MSHVLIRLGIFSTPILLILGVAVGIAWDLGEAVPMDMMIQWMDEDNTILYVPLSRDDRFYFKQKAINAYQPDILFLGSSRADVMTADIFLVPSRVYNAFVNGQTLAESLWLLKQIDEDHFPDIVFLSISVSAFKPNPCVPETADLADPLHPLEQIIIGTRDVWQGILLGNYSLLDFYQARNRPYFNWNQQGINALLADDNPGYQRSGERQRPIAFQDTQLILYDMGIKQLHSQEGIYRADTSDIPCEYALQNLEDIIQYVQAQDARLITYIAPYAPFAYDAFTTESTYSAFHPTRAAIASLMATYDTPFYDFADPTNFDATHRDFYDGHHMGSVLAARVLLTMLRDQSDLFDRYVAFDIIESRINNATHPFVFTRGVRRSQAEWDADALDDMLKKLAVD